jgi:hypothetical protein
MSIMTNCDFCSQPIPQNRLDSVKKKGGIVKYCSDRCNKLSWAKRNKVIKNSFNNGDRKEWLNTETGVAYSWENWVARQFQGVWQGFNKPFDILIGDEKIDVKTCELYKRPNKRGKPVKNKSAQAGWWVFNKNKGNIADFMLCIGLINGVPFKMWKIPSKVFGKSKTISPLSNRFDKYLI